MKGFAFRLERILRLREDAEQRQARKYGEAARAETAAERHCREQAHHLERIGDQLAPPPGQATNAGLLRVLSLTQEAAAKQLDHAVETREEARQTADLERDRLTAARTERKSLEKLRSNRAASYKEELEREDQKVTDEIAARRRRRRP